jgi:hypothetical protein
MSEIKVIVEQLTGACINTHTLKTSGPNGGDSSVIEIELIDNTYESAVEVEKTKSGYKLTYYGDSEGESLVKALKAFVEVLEKKYKTEHSSTRIEITRG